MEEDMDLNHEALVAFLHALAVAVIDLDNPNSVLRDSGRFLQALDAFLDDIPNITERARADEIYRVVRVLRENFDIALEQARRIADQ